MNKISYIVSDDNTPTTSRFPAIDAHNHLWGEPDGEKIIEAMNQTGIISYCDLTANSHIKWAGDGYAFGRGDIDNFFAKWAERYPGKFYCFTLAEFARPIDVPLFESAPEFAAQCVDTLKAHVELGAKGLKILKQLGLEYVDGQGELVHLDDEGLAPIWEAAGQLGVPVLMHQTDPYGFFEPVTPANEHHDTLTKYSSWSFADSKFPGKSELLDRRDRLIHRHPGTTFILPHVANFAENLSAVSRLLDENPNVYIDFSARLDELGRQPYSARKFFLTYQDRIIFGSDMPADLDSSMAMYRSYFRFLETFDEGFYTPDYDGTFERVRWTVCGIGLPDEVLKKIYYKNILKIIPSLRETLKGLLPKEG